MNLSDRDGTQFLLSRYASQLDNDCSIAKQKINAAKSMWDVTRAAGQIHVRSELRGQPIARQSTFAVETAATKRLEEMLQAHIQALAECPNIELMKAKRADYVAGEWQSLRGAFAAVYRRAERDSLQLIHRRETDANNPPVMLDDPTILYPASVSPDEEDTDSAPRY